jgi:hypothetical protein
MTLRDGKIVYELNGLSRPAWTTLPKEYEEVGDPRWDGTIDYESRAKLRRSFGG